MYNSQLVIDALFIIYSIGEQQQQQNIRLINDFIMLQPFIPVVIQYLQ